MGMPRKKSRPLEVREHRLRWLRKGRHRFIDSAPTMHDVTVQHEDGGRVLQFGIVALPPNRRETCRDDEALTGVTPAMVKRVTEAALDHGWDPTAPATAPYLFTGQVDLGPLWRVDG